MSNIICTTCQQNMSIEDNQIVCNTCVTHYCSDTYCMETINLMKGHSWNPLFRFPNEPYIKELLFCASCYDSNCYAKCKSCQIVHSYKDLTVQYGDDAPEWEQLFCVTCIRLRKPTN